MSSELCWGFQVFEAALSVAIVPPGAPLAVSIVRCLTARMSAVDEHHFSGQIVSGVSYAFAMGPWVNSID